MSKTAGKEEREGMEDESQENGNALLGLRRWCHDGSYVCAEICQICPFLLTWRPSLDSANANHDSVFILFL